MRWLDLENTGDCDRTGLEKPGSPEQLCQIIASQGHSVDVLINNAGIAGPNLLEVSDFSTQRDFEQLMMQTVAELCSRLIPGMRERSYGRVINVASVAGRFPSSDSGNYGPAKRMSLHCQRNSTWEHVARGLM